MAEHIMLNYGVWLPYIIFLFKVVSDMGKSITDQPFQLHIGDLTHWSIGDQATISYAYFLKPIFIDQYPQYFPLKLPQEYSKGLYWW